MRSKDKDKYSAPMPNLFHDEIFTPNAPRISDNRKSKDSDKNKPTARPEQRPFAVRFPDHHKQPPDSSG